MVAHSNTIMARLQATAGRHAELARAAAALPMQLRVEVGGLRIGVDAIGIDFDAASWQAEFLAQWPAGSPAHTAYWQRICHGPDYAVIQALHF